MLTNQHQLRHFVHLSTLRVMAFLHELKQQSHGMTNAGPVPLCTIR